MSIKNLIPRQKVPTINLPLVSGESWSLSDENPENFSLLVFYRGRHCPVCRSQLSDLKRNLDKFTELGVNVIAISSDTKERATDTHAAWKLADLRLAYGLSLEEARSWGLFVSKGKGETSIGIEEPNYFSEPGIFLIHPDQSLYFSTIQTMPFARPQWADVLNAIKVVLKKNYPARGEVESIQELLKK